MKIKFEELEYQKKAWESAVNVFQGQEICTTTFSMPKVIKDNNTIDLDFSDKGSGNRLKLASEEILDNVKSVQIKNGLKQSEDLSSKDFTIEMETGTGKTYVYLRSIFEMHKAYGFSKFIIVVPSIAIKEGVNKTLNMTEEHFKSVYDNIPYEYFTYNSDRLEQVRNFATNNNLQIMVINIDAFRRSFTDDITKETKANKIHRWNDKMQGKPIDFIKETNPIVIIDEPQSVDTTAKSSEAIKSLNPLCSFRYSATHIDKHHMLYKLDSIDAYEQQLVKQIEVASIGVKDSHNNAYIKLLEVDNKNSIRAKLELDIRGANGVKRQSKWVKQGTDLSEITKRDIYSNYVINDIYCGEGNEYIDFTSSEDIIRLNEVIGDVNEDDYKRLQIRKTIEEHLDKELMLTPKGIKVLSLFFIDKVSNYRDYETKDNKGKYAKIFEDEYSKLIKKPKYSSLFKEVDTETLASEVHNGYFSTDKKGVAKDTTGKSQADEDTYSLIMKEKEKLLSFDSKLKFIFSHSALKEGWDNPNVFQICTLNETKSVIKKRQEIGRGLRIAVNQNGERIHGFNINTLTVMANESYEDFVTSLQKELETEENIKFGVIENHLFANITIKDENNEDIYLGQLASEKIYNFMKEQNYIDNKGRAKDKLKLDLKNNEVIVPEEFEEHKEKIVASIRKVVKGLEIKNNEDKKSVKLNKEVFYSPEFNALWDRIKYKTFYNVDFDAETLINNCADRLSRDLVVSKSKFEFSKDKIDINRSGVENKEHKEYSYDNDAFSYDVPDILAELQDATNLKRNTIVEILVRSERLSLFKRNPQKFITEVKKFIKLEMQKLIIDGIKYYKIAGSEYPVQELFNVDELKGYLNKNMIETQNSVFDHVVYDSDIEKSLAMEFEADENVKLYLKLPNKFKIDTPLGGYNPDWAVLFEKDGEERLYFVLESKGSLLEESLRELERGKIQCGREHFKALESDVKFEVITNKSDLLDKVG